ncbi:hydrolase [Streptomyces sp. RLA2-12]|uniref:hydrolase n=1 Tax=unclassified Streptomyces TaxID=2593676 RepID=UPI001162C14B|nr:MULTISPECIES: hydrolase [unclassified Streptomyces]NMI54976.1 hydrolase [Streptomyces sp. RLA2-12]QDN62512.1 hydrolase [Streptomyces sp. S1D4-20]QDN72563.1 hydrolase [Streptomyces sp. S1D4-14]QDO55091.1 hydrolase [Streptomyces sp. RLB3-5]QDO65265.1 hydrolase [Streptomyces sp. RLB1-8]
MSTVARTGPRAVPASEESVLVLIDHQPFHFAHVNSHEPTLIVNNVIGLAETAKSFGVPTILTTLVEERGGCLVQGVQDVFPEQKPIDRTFINAWRDDRVVEAVKETGRRKLIIAGLWTEICVAMSAIQAAGEGFEVYVVTDASGGVSKDAHEGAVRRMAQSGVVAITWSALMDELECDGAREEESLPVVAQDQAEYGGVAFGGETQLLACRAGTDITDTAEGPRAETRAILCASGPSGYQPYRDHSGLRGG